MNIVVCRWFLQNPSETQVENMVGVAHGGNHMQLLGHGKPPLCKVLRCFFGKGLVFFFLVWGGSPSSKQDKNQSLLRSVKSHFL